MPADTLTLVSKAAAQKAAATEALTLAIVRARADGQSAVDIAEVAGMTRQGVNKLLRTQGQAEATLETRLSELDGRWNKLAEQAARSWKPIRETRFSAEAELLRVLENRRDEPIVGKIIGELDEAAAIRKQLSTLRDARGPSWALDSPGSLRGVQAFSHSA